MKQPLVTVYITNYNYGHFITQAIESVINQSYENIQILIIDDGSTDNSKEIIEAYGGYPNIDIVYQKNKGLNITNNIALNLARGTYIMRLDADDYLDSKAVEIMASALNSDINLGLVFPDYYIVNASGKTVEQVIRHDFENEVSLLDQPAHGACTLIRTKFLRDLGGYNENYKCQDGYELWIKFTQVYPVKNINKPLFYYRQHGSNLTSNEQKILNTRAAIHNEHIKKTYQDIPTIGIIPVRGNVTSKNSMAFVKLNGKTILQHKIDSAIKTNYLKKIIISSPDSSVKKFIDDFYSHNPRVIFIKRPIEQARINTNLNSTVRGILSSLNQEIDKFLAVALLYIENPFVKPSTVDDAINALFLFGADSLISVRRENNLFFQHHGDGMKPILNQEKFTKLERDNLYRLAGGINICKIDSFNNYKKVLCGKIGHIEVTNIEAHSLQSKFDLELAELIYTRNSIVLK